MLQICIGDYHLCQDCTKSLADTGSTGIDVQLFIFLKYEFHAACIRDTDTDTGILHGAADSHRFSFFQSSIILLISAVPLLRSPQDLWNYLRSDHSEASHRDGSHCGNGFPME